MSGEPDIEQVLRVPGRLSVAPTDFTKDWPFGGIGLGAVSEIVLEPVPEYEVVIGSEYGGEPLDVIELGYTWILGATLREWNSANVAVLFASVTGTSKEKYVVYPVDERPGVKRGSVILLFTPYEAGCPALIAFRALPLVAEATELKLSIHEELVVPVMFHLLRDQSGKGMMKMGLPEDIFV